MGWKRTTEIELTGAEVSALVDPFDGRMLIGFRDALGDESLALKLSRHKGLELAHAIIRALEAPLSPERAQAIRSVTAEFEKGLVAAIGGGNGEPIAGAAGEVR